MAASEQERMARDNVELYRQVIDLQDRDSRRLSRIASLKLDVQRLQAERGEG
jgi:hypothetical protein